MKNNKKGKFQDKFGLLTFLITIVAVAIAHYFKESNDNRTNSNDQLNKNSITYPTCDCGTPMSIFDGCWWHTCPNCGNKKKITETKERWCDEIFKAGSKEINSDFELADLCRGGDLSEE